MRPPSKTKMDGLPACLTLASLHPIHHSTYTMYSTAYAHDGAVAAVQWGPRYPG